MDRGDGNDGVQRRGDPPKVGERVAQIAYALDGEEGEACAATASVVATPAGSTGYNLANGGPVMAWGVEGFVVSFIARHSFAARTLVVAPRDRLTIYNPRESRLTWLSTGARHTGSRPARRSTRGSSTRRGRSPSCRAPRSTAGCARSSGAAS